MKSAESNLSETLKSIRIPMRAKKYHLLINQSQAKNNASFWLSMIRNLSAVDMLHDLVAKLPKNLHLKVKVRSQKSFYAQTIWVSLTYSDKPEKDPLLMPE